MRVPRAAVPLALAIALSGCGKAEAPKTEDPAAERAAATERAREGPMGTQVKALEDAKNLGADLNRKAEQEQEQVDRAQK
ncbi:MAG TPA: hypothetical protein VHQ02_01155 [Usitatibacter sp.]|jgi:hypothetical protein|nr:hypothetical protein [Usitatibacter sp.]